MTNGLPFLQIFPEIIQDSSVAETFRIRAKERNKSLAKADLNLKNTSIEKFRENLFLGSKRNIEAPGKVNFSAKIDFYADGGLKIDEIEHVENIDHSQTLD